VAAGGRVLFAYLVFFTGLGAFFPYLPVFYRETGLGLPEIGFLSALGATVQLALAPVWGGLADRFPRTRLTLPLGCAIAAAGGAALFASTTFEGVLVGSVIMFAGMSGIAPTLDSRTLEILGPERRDRYGQVRAFGSLAFVISTLLVGLVLDTRGARDLFLIFVPALLLAMLVTATIARRGGGRSVNVMRGARAILGFPGVALFLVGFAVIWSALSAVNAFYSVQVVALGGDTALVGIAWSVGAAIEVPFMYAFPRLGARFGTERLLVLGTISFVLRSLLAALATSPAMLVVISPLEGLGYSAVFVGGVTVLAARAPGGMGGTAQGLFAASAGLASIIGSFAGGAIAGVIGIRGLFAIGAGVGCVGTVLVALALLRPGRAVVVASRADA
jgi:PPP family 3-phenylpropionic acid transporter